MHFSKRLKLFIALSYLFSNHSFGCPVFIKLGMSMQVSKYGKDEMNPADSKNPFKVNSQDLSSVEVGKKIVFKKNGESPFSKLNLEVTWVIMRDGKTVIGLQPAGLVGGYGHYYFLSKDPDGKLRLANAWKNGTQFYTSTVDTNVGSDWNFPEGRRTLKFGMRKQVGGGVLEQNPTQDRHPYSFTIKNLKDIKLGNTIPARRAGENINFVVTELKIKDGKTIVKLKKEGDDSVGGHSYSLSVDEAGQFEFINAWKNGTQWFSSF